ncbi:MAG: hypothetical protein KDI77_12940 [Gammaproteobacteria bacterium]|nr:hypothetical protein [Gammaproteobacteria bacterium]
MEKMPTEKDSRACEKSFNSEFCEGLSGATTARVKDCHVPNIRHLRAPFFCENQIVKVRKSVPLRL